MYRLDLYRVKLPNVMTEGSTPTNSGVVITADLTGPRPATAPGAAGRPGTPRGKGGGRRPPVPRPYRRSTAWRSTSSDGWHWPPSSSS